MNKEELHRKKKLIITGIAAQQIYAQCHDEAIELGIFKHDLKMTSNHLVKKLERELKGMFELMGLVQGGDPYLKAVSDMETLFENLALLPVEYWAVVNNIVVNAINHINNEDKNTVTDPSVQSASGSEAVDGLQDSDGEYVDDKEDDQAEY